MTSTSARPVVPRTLYHYTCTSHGVPGIRTSGKLRPWPQPMLGRALVWLTDLDTPDVWALGLTNALLCCDRTEVRVTVHPYGDAAGTEPANTGERTTVVPWWFYARAIPAVLRDIVEDTGAPMHWWVSTRAVPATGMIPTAVLHADSRRRAAAKKSTPDTLVSEAPHA